MEGHCFWLATAVYNDIIKTCPLRSRGEKSFAFSIPRSKEYVNAPDNLDDINFPIQLAFVGEDRTFVLTDHNVCFNIHVMALRYHFEPDDILLGGRVRPIRKLDLVLPANIGKLWPYIWSYNHGPDLGLEYRAATDTMSHWRQEMLDSFDAGPKPMHYFSIFETMTQRQDVCFFSLFDFV